MTIQYYCKKTLLLLFFSLSSISLCGQIVISQIIGNKGSSLNRPNAIEIFNYGGTQLVLNSSNFSVTNHRRNDAGNRTVFTWTPDSDIVLEPSMNFVLIGIRDGKRNTVDPDLDAFLSASGAKYYNASSDELSFDEASGTRLNLNGVVVDQIGAWGKNNANIIPGGGGGNTINTENWERKLEWIETPNTNWVKNSGGNVTGAFLSSFNNIADVSGT